MIAKDNGAMGFIANATGSIDAKAGHQPSRAFSPAMKRQFRC